MELDKVYNMDCIELMRQMSNGGGDVDCVITDPPYLINYKTGRRKDKDHKFCKAIANDNNRQLIIDMMPLLYKVMKDNTPLYMFCGSDNIDFFVSEVKKYFTLRNLIVWDKGNATAGDLEAQYGKGYEFIIYANKGRSKFVEGSFRYTDIWKENRVIGNSQIHQNQKPLPLIEKILLQHTKENDLVFDPFGGSFTTYVACHKLQRHYIGCEIDKEYYKLGNERLEAEKSQLSFWNFQKTY